MERRLKKLQDALYVKMDAGGLTPYEDGALAATHHIDTGGDQFDELFDEVTAIEDFAE